MGTYEKTERIALGIFSFSVIILVVLMFFAVRGNILGKAIQDFNNPANMNGCYDSDELDYNIRGEASICENGKCEVSEDSCSGKSVIEAYCNNNELAFKEYVCAEECSNGVCVTKATKYMYPAGGGNSESVTITTITTTTSSTVAGQTYNLGDLTTEHAVDASKSDSVVFNLGGRQNVLNLVDFTNSQAILSLNGNTINLDVGSYTQLDVNIDGINELYIKVKSIDTVSNKVKLILSSI